MGVMSNDESTSSYFETSDLPLAATLDTLGFILVSLDGSNPARIVFVFLRNDVLNETIGRFWAGTLSVEPKSFWYALRELKARIRNEFGGRGS
jgi:hypothetical protein